MKYNLYIVHYLLSGQKVNVFIANICSLNT